MNQSRELLNLRGQIDTAKTNKAREEGKLQELKSRLETDFNVKNIADAEKLSSKYKQELEIKQAQMDDGLQKLESDYNWE